MKTTALSIHYPLQNWEEITVVPDDALACAIKKLLETDYAESSIKAIRADLKHFLQWYAAANGESFSFQRVTGRDITLYRDTLKKNGLSTASINRKLVSLKQFFAAAVEAKVIPPEKNYALKAKSLTKVALAPKGLSPQEMHKLLKELEVHGNLRDMALIELLLGVGLRASEAANLTVADVQISERKGTVQVRNSKGGKSRAIPLRLSVRTLLTQYMEKNQPTDRLFVGQRGALTALTVNKIVRKYGHKAGVDVWAHRLRHCFAHSFLRENPGDLVSLAQLMGHASLNTTSVYTQASLTELQEKVERITV